MYIQPVIKWSGSKRSQAEKIVSMMPKEINTYYEPFLGGGSVFIKLAMSKKTVNKYVLSDINQDLIDLWRQIKTNPKSISLSYTKMWNEMYNLSDWESKKKYYFDVRDRFNNKKSLDDFMFIMRTAYNGMPRYNKKGLFNSPLHPKRNGIHPEKLNNILIFWNKILNDKNVVFLCKSYEETETRNDDFLYLDPPYAGIKGMYYGTLDDYNLLWDFLKKQKSKWMLSFHRKTTSTELQIKIPKEIYISHELLESGNSSFRRLNGTSNKEYVFESLYKNY